MAQPSGTEREQRQAQTILFTDIVGSSQYFAERGDTAGLKMLARHNQLLFPIVTAAGGRVVKTIGDSIFATFGNPGQAVRAAWAMQRKLEEANQAAGEGEAIRIRIGVHYGLVTVQKGDVFGDAVNMAERVKSKAGGGQITLSRVVRDLLRADPRIGVRSLGMVELKGSPEPVELFEFTGRAGGRDEGIGGSQPAAHAVAWRNKRRGTGRGDVCFQGPVPDCVPPSRATLSICGYLRRQRAPIPAGVSAGGNHSTFADRRDISAAFGNEADHTRRAARRSGGAGALVSGTRRGDEPRSAAGRASGLD
ncbi:MAG: adenylate/guanylate cyclase domain-containing protein [Acidobacteria bacterium]|nr:adenylate/guanylate cyclase domain-containing protein [Acidobacteriota bacterium]